MLNLIIFIIEIYLKSQLQNVRLEKMNLKKYEFKIRSKDSLVLESVDYI